MLEQAMWRNSSRIWYDIKSAINACREVVVFDLETTGLSRTSDRIIELAAVRYHLDDDLNMHEEDTLHLFINPRKTLSEEIIELTGISNEQLVDMPTEEEVFEEIQDFFESFTVAGYNIETFDVAFMENLYGRIGCKFRPAGCIDGIKMARDRLVKDRDVTDFKLASVAGYFGISFHAHQAIEDARATAKVIQLLLKEYQKTEQKLPDIAPTGIIQPEVTKIAYWAGFKGHPRLYVTTEAGTVYYDIRNRAWGGKDINISTLDMKWLEAEAWQLTESVNEAQFARFTGEWTG